MDRVLLLAALAVLCIGVAAAARYDDYYYGDDIDPHYGAVGAGDYMADYTAPANYDYPSYDDYGQRGYGAGSPYRGQRGDATRYGHRNYHRPTMVQYAKSYHPKPQKEFVPVVIKKKKQKKKKILTTHHGFYSPGGTAMFGKFKDLHSCMKACEITPTCFAGDFNPWLGKCFLHSNLTACASLRSHKAITHFKKVPCNVLESSRGYIVLGASVTHGIEIKGIDSLQDCLKKCATAGGGIAPDDAEVQNTPQLCCNIDYDFATHKCFFHLCGTSAQTIAQFCAPVPEAPLNSVPSPSTISITLCPLAPPP